MKSFVLLGIAGLCLITAIIFVIKYFFDNKKNDKTASTGNADLTIEVTDNKSVFNEKAKKDLIIAFIFMAFCEVFIILSKHVH